MALFEHQHQQQRQLKTDRINHPALVGQDGPAVIHFYTQVLGMPLVLRQPNLDFPTLEHLFFDCGNDCFIAYFVPASDQQPLDPPVNPQGLGTGWSPGSLRHLAFDVSPEVFSAAQVTLKEHGITFRGPISRGYEVSIYFPDPSGYTLEFLTWTTPPPADLPQAQIIARAQRIREAAGAAYVDDPHIRQAIDELRAERP
ncbi:MAG: VOC family protein [Chloroflexi bacterium]|nr:VOC family protein [Chloroflexota bacterium]